MTDAAAKPRRGRPGHDRKAVLRVAIDLFNRKGCVSRLLFGMVDSLVEWYRPGGQ